jgi:hypothetical protein
VAAVVESVVESANGGVAALGDVRVGAFGRFLVDGVLDCAFLTGALAVFTALTPAAADCLGCLVADDLELRFIVDRYLGLHEKMRRGTEVTNVACS